MTNVKVPENLRDKIPEWTRIIENNNIDDVYDEDFEIMDPKNDDKVLRLSNYQVCVGGELYKFHSHYTHKCETCEDIAGQLLTTNEQKMQDKLNELAEHVKYCPVYKKLVVEEVDPDDVPNYREYDDYKAEFEDDFEPDDDDYDDDWDDEDEEDEEDETKS